MSHCRRRLCKLQSILIKSSRVIIEISVYLLPRQFLPCTNSHSFSDFTHITQATSVIHVHLSRIALMFKVHARIYLVCYCSCYYYRCFLPILPLFFIFFLLTSCSSPSPSILLIPSSSHFHLLLPFSFCSHSFLLFLLFLSFLILFFSLFLLPFIYHPSFLLSYFSLSAGVAPTN